MKGCVAFFPTMEKRLIVRVYFFLCEIDGKKRLKVLRNLLRLCSKRKNRNIRILKSFGGSLITIIVMINSSP
jgi:hypothetical protein